MLTISIDKLGDIAMVVNVLALPLLLDSFDFENLSKVSLMYAEAALITYGFKDILKALVSRPRPYVFSSDTPSKHGNALLFLLMILDLHVTILIF